MNKNLLNQCEAAWQRSFDVLTSTAAALALCAVLTMGANTAQGQMPVTWNAPGTIAGDTDVATDGTTVFAYDWNGDALVVNGVSFTAPGAGITLPAGISGPNNVFASGLTGLSADYTALVTGAVWDDGGSFSFALNGLTSGHNYLVQIWVNDSRNLGSLRTETVSGGGNTSGDLVFPANSAGAPGSYVTGTFTTVYTNEVLAIDANQSAQINAIQLRDLGASTTNVTPLFSPPAGQYDGALTVTISAFNGSTVFYTTNGSSPNSSSLHGVVGSGFATVSVPAPITMTINAYATNGDLADSAIATATYVTLMQSSGVWTNLAGGSWTNSANWSDGVIASGADATADFSQLSLTNQVAVTLDGDKTIGNLLFDDQSGSLNSWKLDPGAGGVLTLAVTNGSPVISNNVQTAISATVAGTNGLVKTGTGKLKLTGDNIGSMSGGVIVNDGELVLQRPFGGSYIGGPYVVNPGATLNMKNSTGHTLDGGWEVPVYINGGTVDFSGSSIVRYGGMDMTGGTVNWSAGGGFYGNTISTHATNVTAVISGSGFGYPSTYTFNVERGTAPIDLTLAPSITQASFVLQGGGVMELTGDSTTAGTATVNAGTLLVDNALENSAVTVNTNGVLGGMGTINGTVTVNDGGTLAVNTVTDSSAVLGTLTLGSSPTVNAGGVTYLRLTKTGGALGSDEISLTAGTLTYSGTLVVTNITSDGTMLAAGDTFTLFNAGAYGGSFDNLVLPALPAGLIWRTGQLGVNGTISVSSGVADVVFSPAGGQYVTAQAVTLSCATPGATIYYTTDGTTPTTSSSVYTGPIMVPVNTAMTIKAFGHLAGKTDSDVGSATYVTYPTYVWNNPVGGSWADTGSWTNGVVPNAGDVTADFSTLTLSSPAYVSLDGSWTVGNLIFGDAGDAYTWELDSGGLNSLTLAASSGMPTITVNNQTTIMNAKLSGTQGFVKAGAGTLEMVLPVTTTGATTITNGTVQYDVDYLSTGDGFGVNNIGSSGTVNIYSTTPSGFRGLRGCVFTGSGTITKTGSGIAWLWTASSWSAFTGVVDVQAGTLYANNMTGGGNGAALTLNIAAGATFDQVHNSAVAVDKLTGTGTLEDDGDPQTFSVGNNNGSSTFAGVIQNTKGPLGLTKNGTGTFVLAGANTYTGNTAVNGGVLLVDGSMGGSPIAVTNATLGGTGTIAGLVTINSGGTLAPGTNGLGTLTVNSNVTMNAGANAQFTVGTSGSQLAVNGDLTLNGTLNVTAGPGFGLGTYTVATYSGALSGSLSVGTVPAGYGCSVDTSTAGVVKVVVSASPVFSSVGPLSGQSFPLTFSGPDGQTYKVLTSTNLALPLASWTVLGTGTFGSGPVTYTNTDATNGMRFYSIQTP